MVNGGRGFGRLSTPLLQTDWSKTVERLLTVTYARAFHHKPSLGPFSAPRGIHVAACLTFATAVDLTDIAGGQLSGRPPFGDAEIIMDDGGPSGISVFHVKLTTAETVG